MMSALKTLLTVLNCVLIIMAAIRVRVSLAISWTVTTTVAMVLDYIYAIIQCYSYF